MNCKLVLALESYHATTGHGSQFLLFQKTELFLPIPSPHHLALAKRRA